MRGPSTRWRRCASVGAVLAVLGGCAAHAAGTGDIASPGTVIVIGAVDGGRPFVDVPAPDIYAAVWPRYRATAPVPALTNGRRTRPSFAACVIHSGSGSEQAHARSDGGGLAAEIERRACTLNAQCSGRADGGAGGGDRGFVGLDCIGRQCRCRLERTELGQDTRESWGESFEIEDGCDTADLARRLLREICMRGMDPPVGAGFP